MTQTVDFARIGRPTALLLCMLLIAHANRARAQASAIGEPYLTVTQGTLPIIVTAPHGGSTTIPGVPDRVGRKAGQFVVVRDTSTDLLARKLAESIEREMGRKPFVVIAHFPRSEVDANRPAADAYESERAKPYYEAYHEAVRSACREVDARWGHGLLLDLHAQAADTNAIYRGTNNGATVAAMVERSGADAFVGPNSVLGAMEALGYHIVPACASGDREDPHFNGGYTVQTYGGPARAARGISAIQLETGGRFRTARRLGTTAADLARAIRGFPRAPREPSHQSTVDFGAAASRAIAPR